MASSSWVKEYKWLLGALLVGGLIRAVFIFAFSGDFQKDPDGYRQIAENLVNAKVYGQSFGKGAQPTAYRPPLYPWILSFLVTEHGTKLRSQNQPDWSLDLGSVAMMHVMISVATIFCAFLWAFWLGLGGPGSFAVALLVALDPIGLRQSSLIMTETLAVFCATLGLCLLTGVFAKKRGPFYSLICGVALGIFALCRPTFLIWGGLVFIALAVRAFQSKQQPRVAWGRAGCLVIGMVIALSPWMIRNQLEFGKPVFATTHGGYTIFLGNNDSFYDYLRSGSDQVWDGEAELKPIVEKIREASQLTPLDKFGTIDEVKKDRLYYDKAMEVIKRRPGDFVYACLIRVVRFWSVIPNLPASRSAANSATDEVSADDPAQLSKTQRMIRIGSAVWYSAVFLCALWGAFRMTKLLLRSADFAPMIWSRVYPAILLVAAFQGLHVLYWSNMRMRAPLVVFIAVLAVSAFIKPRFEQNGVTSRGENSV